MLRGDGTWENIGGMK
ncbi:hypothetical protein ACR82U_005219 [Escherichia coli]